MYIEYCSKICLYSLNDCIFWGSGWVPPASTPNQSGLQFLHSGHGKFLIMN